MFSASRSRPTRTLPEVEAQSFEGCDGHGPAKASSWRFRKVGAFWKDQEKQGCGIGSFELALVLPGLMWMHRRRRRLH